MAVSRLGGLDRSLDRYDGLAGLLALGVLGAALLVFLQPLVGLVVALGLLSTYGVVRRDGLLDGGVVAGLWGAVLWALWFLGLVLGVVTGLLALVAWGLRQRGR